MALTRLPPPPIPPVRALAGGLVYPSPRSCPPAPLRDGGSGPAEAPPCADGGTGAATAAPPTPAPSAPIAGAATATPVPDHTPVAANGGCRVGTALGAVAGVEVQRASAGSPFSDVT